MDITEILITNPVFITSIVSSVIGLCGALGIKELLAKGYERYCKKTDGKEADHQKLEEMKESIDEIIRRLEQLEKNDEESTTNDMLLIEDRLLWMQRKAIDVQKVSRGCIPRYKVLLKRYQELNKKTEIDLNEEIAFNDVQINKLISDGAVVDTWEEALR